ncbi:MAG: 5'/3'-nucleotidase SurE [Bacteroidaceae bacterium]|nr:5'/3'-nucleotidase SurE [Bacteroidaceae bacterium]
MQKQPLILVTNDDGLNAQGISVLIKCMQELGQVVVVAPNGARSGSACSITPIVPVTLKLEREEENLSIYSCSGTPVDCVKLAYEKVVHRKPDLVVSGINHGDNASVSLHYSGTMGAVLEGCMKGIPSIGYSLRTRKQECDFRPYLQVVKDVASHVLKNGLPQDVCLNVNFPEVPALKGVSVCRMARGIWQSEWKDTDVPDVYQLTGNFTNLEPEAEDTDYWALDHGMASITPLSLDMTDYSSLEILKSLQR